jgi:hypothetical protein
MILELILEKYSGTIINWIYLAKERDQWRAVVNVVMNLRDL